MNPFYWGPTFARLTFEMIFFLFIFLVPPTNCHCTHISLSCLSTFVYLSLHIASHLLTSQPDP